MEKIFNSDKFGEVIVRNAMLESNDETTLNDGIEIKGDEIGLIEIYKYYDIDELTIDELDKIIEYHL